MQADDLYLEVLREFVELTGADASGLELGCEVSFEFDGMLAFLFMHPLQEAVVIDVEILQLAEPRSEPANLERLLLLHQLNSVTRFTHGAQAFISVDNMVMLSHSLPMTGLNGQQLADFLSQLLDTASQLRATWNDLRSLIGEAGRSIGGAADGAPALMPTSFA